MAVTDQLALVMLGGLLGVIALRLTAGFFVRWLELFSRLETAGYLAVGLVGIRLLLRVLLPDFEVPEWGLLLIVACLFLWGFSQRTPLSPDEPASDQPLQAAPHAEASPGQTPAAAPSAGSAEASPADATIPAAAADDV